MKPCIHLLILFNYIHLKILYWPLLLHFLKGKICKLNAYLQHALRHLMLNNKRIWILQLWDFFNCWMQTWHLASSNPNNGLILYICLINLRPNLILDIPGCGDKKKFITLAKHLLSGNAACLYTRIIMNFTIK